MLPDVRLRVYNYRRYSRAWYVSWLETHTGLEFAEDVYRLPSRASIDEYVEGLLKPSWVEAALEVDGIDEVADAEPQEDSDDTPDEVADAISPFTPNDYDSYTIRELQDICRQRGLTIRGTKAEVVLRLRRDDDGITEAQPDQSDTEAPSEEAADESPDAPSEEAATEEVTNNADSGEKQNIDEEE
tara:strand:+ start:407 stop:964 length:558 start_codon:yes stop_codon:yes gene_type:complete